MFGGNMLNFSALKMPDLKGPPRYYAIILLAGLLGTSINYMANPPKPFRHPHIKAAPYIWPPGCPPGKYTDDPRVPIQEISPLCATDQYRMDDWEARNYGLYFSGDEEHYYRVETSLLRLSCFNDRIFKGREICTVSEDIKNSYFQ